VKVLDFGISKTMIIGSAEQSLTQTSTIMGSPFYMSPEQMRTPRNVDVRSDIWALGAILYDLLCGQPPFVAETIPQLCTMMLESEPLPIRGLRPEVPVELEAVIMRCLAKDISKRWSSVADVGQPLLRFASRSSKIHVERAGRVLSASGAASVPVESTVHSSEALRPATPGLGSATPTQASMVPSEAASSTSTQDSWGTTQQRRLESQANSGSVSARPAWQKVAVAGAALLLAGLGFAIFAKSGSHSSSDDPPSTPAVLVPADPVRAAIEPATPPAAIPPINPAPAADPSSVVAAPLASVEPAKPQTAKRHRGRPEGSAKPRPCLRPNRPATG